MQQGWFRWIVSGVLVAVVAVLTGCEGDKGGDKRTPTPGLTPANIAGTWQGGYTYKWSTTVGNKRGNGSDTVTLAITQNGNDIVGTIDEYSADGFVDGNNIWFNADKYKLQGTEVSLKLTATYDGTSIVNVNGDAKAEEAITGIKLAEGTVHADRLTRVK